MAIRETDTTQSAPLPSPPEDADAQPAADGTAAPKLLNLTIRALPLKQAPMEAVIRRET